jgi:hypothetical protein
MLLPCYANTSAPLPCKLLTMVGAGVTPFLTDPITGKMIQIKLTRSDVDHRWSVSLLDQQNIFWSSPENIRLV